MHIRLDSEVNALYITLRQGRVARTVELSDTIYIDMDAQDVPLGIEFVNADEFIPFLRDHADDEALPRQLRDLFRGTAA